MNGSRSLVLVWFGLPVINDQNLRYPSMAFFGTRLQYESIVEVKGLKMMPSAWLFWYPLAA